MTPIEMHQMRISTIIVSSVMLDDEIFEFQIPIIEIVDQNKKRLKDNQICTYNKSFA